MLDGIMKRLGMVAPTTLPGTKRNEPTDKPRVEWPPEWVRAKQASDEEDIARDEMIKRDMKEMAAQLRRLNTITMPALRKATPEDYIEWLQRAAAAGTKPTHFYDYRLPDDFYVAMEDVTVCPAFGAMSINIIVLSEDIKVHIEGLGHNNVFMPDGSVVDRYWVPIYSDVMWDHD